MQNGSLDVSKKQFFISNLGFRVIFGYFLDTWLVKITYVKLLLHLPRDHFLYCILNFGVICWGVESRFFISNLGQKRHAAGSPQIVRIRSHRPQDGAREFGNTRTLSG